MKALIAIISLNKLNIYCREYIEAGIDLWYSKGDQTSAQLQMAADVNNLIHYNPSLSIEQAMDFLLQPRIDYLSSFTTLNPSTTQDNLSLMIIDKDKSSFDDSSKSILQSLRECNRFSITCTHAMSAEQSLKIISNSSDGVINKIDIIILDSNLYENRDINYLSLLRMFRSVYGETILIGVLFPTLSHVEEEFRQRAIKAGVDFIWAKPVAQYADMLPLLISIRRAKDAAKL